MPASSPPTVGNPLPAGALATAALCAMLAVSVAWAMSNWLPLAPYYPLRVVLIFAIVMAFALSASRRHHRHGRFGAANRVTTIRAALAAVVAGALGEQPSDDLAMATAVLGAIGVSLDGVDGWLARRTGLASEFGARFDMEIDALLILVLCVVAWRHGKAGSWVVTSGLLRYGFVAAGWAWQWVRQPLPASKRRQTVCVVQILALLVVLAPVVRSPSSDVIAAASVVALCYSFLVDIRWLWLNAPRLASVAAPPTR
jgi:phosphatidylglycerophosphate synthase